jgi:hypothetical protein
MKNGMLILAAIAAVAVVATNKKESNSISFSPKPQANLKFPGYEIKNQILTIIDETKAKKYVFDIGKKEPEGAIFKLVFGSDKVMYVDTKQPANFSTTVYLIVREKTQQDAIYTILSYLFAGAYVQSPHRLGHFADLLNNYVVFLKNMFNVDYPVIETIEQAEKYFSGIASSMK